jgi:hypothetical protein
LPPGDHPGSDISGGTEDNSSQQESGSEVVALVVEGESDYHHDDHDQDSPGQGIHSKVCGHTGPFVREIHVRLDDHATHLRADRDGGLETPRTGMDVTDGPMLENYLIQAHLPTGTLKICLTMGFPE